MSPTTAEERLAPAGRSQPSDPTGACPLCHTVNSGVTEYSLINGASWLCARCGQTWNARRLATALAYKAWAGAQERVREM